MTDRDEWLAWRRGGIGASDIAGILGISPWASPYSVWANKVGLVADEESTEQMEMGLDMEPAVERMFHRKTGLWVACQQEPVQHPDLPWARASLDGRVFESQSAATAWDWNLTAEDDEALDGYPAALGNYEGKTTSDSVAKWEEGVPVQYETQVQWQMFVTGAEHTWVGCLHASFGAKFRVYEIHRNDDDIAFIYERVARFWTDHILTGTPPETDAHTATTDTLGRLPADAGEIVDLSDLSAEFARLEALRATRANTEERIDAIENAIKARMGSATEAMVGGRVAATWRQSDRTTIDTKALKAALPDVANEFSKTSSSRRFLLKTEKE